MKLLVISCSLSSSSHSVVMAQCLAKAWKKHDAEIDFADLRDIPLPFCDGGGVSTDQNVLQLRTRIEQADAVALAVPIYNYDVGGAARNLLALTGRAWQDKVVGLVAAAGGQRSYMSLMSLANSLMLDFRCVIVPRFVYASSASFAEGQLHDAEVDQRIETLAGELHRIAGALNP